MKNPIPSEFSEVDDSTGLEADKAAREASPPFDPALIRVQILPYTVDLLIARIREGELNLAPGFQRMRDIWNEVNQSRLIESLLVKIPLPTFYIDAEGDDRWSVIDGLQRLNTLKRFIMDEDLRLSGMEFLADFEGRIFSELPRSYQRRILETQVTLHVIEAGTPSEVKFNIFKRINTGGSPLSPQEIRHALNQGPAAELLEKLAESEEFLNATAGSINDKRMGDRECVLRFLAFALKPWEHYNSKSFDAFLSDQMAAINDLSAVDRKHLSERFLRAMRASIQLFGDEAFRKPQRVFGKRNPINKALFETWSVNLDRLSNHQLKLLVTNRKVLLSLYYDAFDRDSSFYRSISLATGDVSRIRERFSSIQELVMRALEVIDPLHDL